MYIIEDCKEEMSVACIKMNTKTVYLKKFIHLDQSVISFCRLASRHHACFTSL